MTVNTLEIKTAMQIQKPAADVFEAIVNPQKMRQYFISQSSGRMEAGKQVTWTFPEFEEEVPIQVNKIEQDRYISFYWKTDGQETLVEIMLTSEDNKATLVTVTEKSHENNKTGLAWLQGNTQGWAFFLAFLKAYLEYGINLRKGAFDFMRS